MKFSEQWLREYVNPNIDTLTLMQVLTMSGLEVDTLAPVAGQFEGVVVGRVITKQKHPDADKLSVCQVDVGEGELLNIVCGAKNVAANMNVPVAKIGAVLPGDFTIKRAKLRGVESQGMICSAAELGLAESSDGILPLPEDAPIGEDFRDYMQLNDVVFDVELTPNRADCLSILGLAREVGAIESCEVTPFEPKTVKSTSKATQAAAVSAPGACPRYLTRVIEKLDNTGQSPLWLQEKLRRCGVKSISPVVDATNYVMLLLGQPLHAFDASAIHGQINVRYATKGEALTLLDGQKVKLTDNTLVIADSKSPLALAGIMGGEASGVIDKTHKIVLEAAWFSPLVIAGRARQYNLHTDASHRFERGVDPSITKEALEIATRLILDIVGGEAGPIVSVESKAHLPKPVSVTLRYTRLPALVGIEMKPKEIHAMLERLGFVITKHDTHAVTVKVPASRFDIAIEEDLIEEIARLQGYDAIPDVLPTVSVQPNPPLAAYDTAIACKKLLIGRGFCEAITYSFIDPQLSKTFEHCAPHQLQNPISNDMAVMRTSLIPGLLQAAQYNMNRQQSRVRLFEQGRCYWADNSARSEPEMLAAVISGDILPELWREQLPVDYYHLKSDVEALLTLQPEPARFAPVHDVNWLHPGQAAVIHIGDQRIGMIGKLHPAVQKQFDLKAPVYVFELRLDALAVSQPRQYEGVSKFPTIRRDIAIEIEDKIHAQSVLDTVYKAGGEYLFRAHIFDVYQGDKLPAGKKSIAVGLILQSFSHTLTDDQINQAVDNVVNALSQHLDATLRG